MSQPPSATGPRPASPGAQFGIDEAMIETLVTTFYARARQDPLLGPVFNSKVEDWPAHLSKIGDFWSTVLLQTRRFEGRPMPAHARIREITPAHFARWLELFGETAHELWSREAADYVELRARQIGGHLMQGHAAYGQALGSKT